MYISPKSKRYILIWIVLTDSTVNILNILKFSIVLKARASHGPGPSVTESVGRSLGHSVTHTLADLCSI